jgi:L-iditol 2-dehydrogenase
MRVAKLVKKFEIVIEEVEAPVCGPDEVLIETKYAGVCGSDLHAFEGKHPFRKPPVVLGHEMVGTIAEIGEMVKDFEIGQPVTVMPYLHCGRCQNCNDGRFNICMNRVAPGVGSWCGTFAQKFLAKSRLVYPLGKNTSFEVGALAEPFAVGVHTVRRANIKDGSKVGVLGVGTIGLLTGIAAKIFGAKSVAVTDINRENLKLSRELFGASTYDVSDEKAEENILRDYPDGFDAIVICGNAPSMIRQAQKFVKPGGRIVIAGIFMEHIKMNLVDLTLNETEVVGTMLYEAEDFNYVIGFLNKNDYKYEKLITHKYPLLEAQNALESVRNPTINTVKVLLF